MLVGDFPADFVDGLLLQHIALIFVHAIHEEWIAELSSLYSSSALERRVQEAGGPYLAIAKSDCLVQPVCAKISRTLRSEEIIVGLENLEDAHRNDPT